MVEIFSIGSRGQAFFPRSLDTNARQAITFGRSTAACAVASTAHQELDTSAPADLGPIIIIDRAAPEQKSSWAAS